jgi:hypothetical protein
MVQTMTSKCAKAMSGHLWVCVCVCACVCACVSVCICLYLCLCVSVRLRCGQYNNRQCGTKHKKWYACPSSVVFRRILPCKTPKTFKLHTETKASASYDSFEMVWPLTLILWSFAFDVSSWRYQTSVKLCQTKIRLMCKVHLNPCFRRKEKGLTFLVKSSLSASPNRGSIAFGTQIRLSVRFMCFNVLRKSSLGLL